MRTALAADGTARFRVAPGNRVTKYVARLQPTGAHGPAQVAVVVPPG